MLKTCNFFTNKLIQKGSITNSDQVFSYLLQFLRTLKTHFFHRTYFMAAYEIGTKTDE